MGAGLCFKEKYIMYAGLVHGECQCSFFKSGASSGPRTRDSLLHGRTEFMSSLVECDI